MSLVPGSAAALKASEKCSRGNIFQKPHPHTFLSPQANENRCYHWAFVRAASS